MAIEYSQYQYLQSMAEEVCPEDVSGHYVYCGFDLLSAPTIQVIPTRQVSRDIFCTTPTCSIGLQETVSVSTTHSAEARFAAEVSAKSFGVGVSFTASIGYGFSHTRETSTSLDYIFNLERGDAGYMVNAQISAHVRFVSCTCRNEDRQCIDQCHAESWDVDQVGHHQKVILKDGTPRGYLAFIYTN